MLLRETCSAKLKANSVKQEHEKQDELKRSAIRAFLAIYKIRDAGMFYRIRTSKGAYTFVFFRQIKMHLQTI